MRSFRHIFNVCVFIFAFTLTHAQSEDELNTSATKLFEKEQYVEATSFYLRLISLHPKNPDYNFRYGTCLLYNSFQKEKAIRYLSFAITEPTIDPRAFYFHGKALHLNFQFDEAIKSYRKYMEKRGSRDKRYNVEREIEMCENGKKLLITFTDIIVSEKQEIDKEKFFRLYKNMETIGGDILVSAEFQSKLDKKLGHVPIVHFPPQAKAIYYSSYGEDGSTGLDIYIRRRLPDGTWGDPQILPGQVNSVDDEDFPYMHPSGDFLYFSSKGHNSMGGYDIFFSRYNPDDNVFGKPENVDFAISSPDDDFFYVVDSEFKSAYFASARQSENGKLHVYNVRVARVPIQQVIVMGDFISEINPNNETMKITVKQNSNGAEVGKIISNEQGKYSFVFPKGGKYNYEITIDGKEDVYKFLVELPYLDEFRPLKQKAVHKMVEGEEIVTIINLFDERVEGAEALIAEVIRKKSSLNVNIDNFDLDQLDQQLERDKLLAEIGFNNMTVDEVGMQLSDMAKMEKEKAITIEKLEANLDLEVLASSERLKELSDERKELLIEAENATDPFKKHALLVKAKSIEEELVKVTEDITSIVETKQNVLKNVGAPPVSGVGKMEVLENQFKSLIAQEKEDEALALLTKNKELLKKSRNESPEKFIQQLVDGSIALNEKIKTLKKQQLEYELSESKLNSQINQLENQLIEAKKKEAEEIRAEIANKKSELKLVKEVLNDTKNIIASKNNELNTLNKTIASLKKAISNDDLVAYQKGDVAKVLKEVEAVEIETAGNSITEQIETLESANPELKLENTAEVTAVETKDFATIQSEQKKQVARINAETSLSEAEKLEEKIKIGNKSISEINKRLDKLKQEINSSPDNLMDLLSEQAELSDYKARLEKENLALNNSLRSLNEASVDKIDVATVKKEYKSQITQITNNNNLSEEEKLEAKIASSSENINEVAVQIKAIEKEINGSPDNLIDVLTQKDELEAFKKQLESEKNVFMEQLNAVRNPVAEDDIIAIQNEWNKKISAIDQNNSLSEEEKITAKRTVNDESINEISERFNALEEKLSVSPNDETLLNEQTALMEYKSELESENRIFNEQLASQSPVAGTNISIIQEERNEKISAINQNNSLSEEEQIGAKRIVNEESINEISERFNALEEKLSVSPNDETLLNEQTALMEYKSELESENRIFNEQLASQSPVAGTNISIIQEERNEKISAINQNNSLSEEEKIGAKRTVNEESINEISERFNALEEKLSVSPNDETLLNEQTALMEYKSELIQENNTLNAELLALQNSTVDTNLTRDELISKVAPDYSEEMKATEANVALSELEKLRKQQSLDEQLLKALTKELTSSEKKLARQPDDVNERVKKELLEELVGQQEGIIAERSQVINAKNQVSSVTDIAVIKSALLEEVSQNYLDEKRSIENSSQTNYEKSLAIIDLAVDQLERLEKKEAELEKALKRKQADETLVAQKQAIDELITEHKRELEALMQRALDSISAQELAEKVTSVDPNYAKDVNAIKAENSLTKGNDIAEREVVLQEKLEKAIEAKENLLKRSYSVTVELEKAIFEKALEESKVREENARSTSESTEKPNAIAQVRSNNEQGIETSLASNPRTKIELEKNDAILAEYEVALKTRIVEVTEEIDSNPSEELSNEKQLLEEELAQVQEKRRQFSVSFGELETTLVSSNSSNERINEIAQEKQDILAKINDPEVSTSEKKQLQKTLNSIENEQAEIENEQAELTLEESKKENEELITELNSVESTNSTLAEKTTEVNEAEVANIEAIKKAATTAKSEKEKQHLLQEAEERQSLLNSALKEVVTTQKQIDLEEKESISVTSREELEVQQRKFSIQIGELTTQIVATEKEIASAKKKEIPELETKRQQLINQRSLLEMQLATIEERIAKEEQPLTRVVTAESFEQTISFNEERKVASSDKYEPYYELATKTLEIEREIATLESELNSEQKNVRSLLEMQLANEKAAEIQLSVDKIKTIEEKIDRLKIEHTQQKYAAEQLLSENTDEAMKMQNLVIRGVQPIQATLLATSLIAMPSTGFAIDESAPSAYTVENPIPIDVESPSGLYYRVQIGAFAKPIPQDLFSEFTPVSGEKIEGSNIVRYMAGFFNNSSAVTDARSKIRSLGYSDAFIVAYCDGKRINFGEARRLEVQGLCVPMRENELVLEVVTKTAEKLGLPMTGELQAVPEVTYNQSPGAADADPIELKKGLFFTVQVGVYNRPIAAENVFGMDELITLRLPNGQIRYSSGVFNSVDAAKPRRTEALEKGVVGAFITAYYNGERISLSEAKRLLDENGTSILQSEIEKNTTVVELEKPAKGTRTDSVSVENIATSAEVNTRKIQLVSKERFEEFPRDELNRFNSEANFYYDQTDKRLKSIVYNHEDDLPRLWNFKDVLDTVYLATDEVDLTDQQVLVVKTVGTSIPGDFMDWLNREPYQRAFKRNEEGVEITLSGIESNRILEVQELIRTFGVSIEVRNAADVEFEK